MPKLFRTLSIERDATGIPLGYSPESRECGLSFSSETDEVWRGCDSYAMRDALKSDQYREILNHDDADLGFLRASGSLLKNHDPNQIIGSIEHVECSGNRCNARVKFTSTQAGKDAETEVREGALKSTSFGYEHKPNARIIPMGEKYTHHGREYNGPAVLTGFRALEVTLTPIPADSSTGVGRSKESALEVPIMPDVAIKPEVRKYCRTAGVKHKLTRDEIEKIISLLPCDNEEVDAEIQLTIGERATTETKTANTAPLSRGVVASILNRGKLADLSIEDITTISTTATDEHHASTLIMDAVAKRAATNGGGIGGVRTGHNDGLNDETEKKLKWAEGCFAHEFLSELRSYPPELSDLDGVKKRSDPTDFEDYVKEFKDLNCRKQEPSKIADVFLSAIGVDATEMPTTRSKAQFLFGQECSNIIRDRVCNRGKMKLMMRDNGTAAISGTASFPFLFENIQTKLMRQMYKRADPTWQYWCKKGSLKDFKRASRIAVSDAGDLLLLRENEAPRGANFSDEAESIQLSKYGRKYSFSWETWVNDDVGGMARATMDIAQAVMRLPSKLLYTDLLSNPTMNADNVALFNSAHNNTQTGAMGATAVNTMWTAMKKQKGKIAPKDSAVQIGGVADNLDLMPRIILGPPDVWYAASKLFTPNIYPSDSTGAQAGANFFTGNVPGVGKLEFLCESRLSNTDYTSYSATAFYMIADPRLTPCYEVAFLDGSSEPILIQRQDYQTLGVDTTVTLPVGIKALEWRPIQYTTGS